MLWRNVSIAGLSVLLFGCESAALRPPLAVEAQPVAVPAQEEMTGRRLQSSDGVSNAEASGSGSQLPDAGTAGTNGQGAPGEEPNPIP